MSSQEINEDFEDIIAALVDADCEFLIVGAHALAMHGVPRATGDLDILIRPSIENARKLIQALQQFGAPIQAHGISANDFTQPGMVYQLGLPPRRIDILTEITGVSFDGSCEAALSGNFGRHSVRCIGLKALIANKRATGRAKDIADVQQLEAILKRDGIK